MSGARYFPPSHRPFRHLRLAVPCLLVACSTGPEGNWPSLSVPPTGAVAVTAAPQPDLAPPPPAPAAAGADIDALTGELSAIEQRWQTQAMEARAAPPGTPRDRALSRLDAIFLEAPALAARVVAPSAEQLSPEAAAFLQRVDEFRGRHMAALAELVAA